MRCLKVVPILFFLLSGISVHAGDSTPPKTEKSTESVTDHEENSVADRSRECYLLLEEDPPEARACFEDLLKDKPGIPSARTGLGIALAREGRLDEAEKALREALVLNPDPVRVHYELGCLYQKMNEHEKAMSEFKTGIAKYQEGRR